MKVVIPVDAPEKRKKGRRVKVALELEPPPKNEDEKFGSWASAGGQLRLRDRNASLWQARFRKKRVEGPLASPHPPLPFPSEAVFAPASRPPSPPPPSCGQSCS